MVRSKVALISSFIIFLICMYLYFPYPSNEMIDARIIFMSFPISNQDGYNTLGIVGSVLFIIAMILLVRGINKYHFRIFLITLFSYSFLPVLIIFMYQETIAGGISAISYDGKGTCDFEQVSEDELYGECNLRIHNRSGKTVSFELEFLDSLLMENDTRLESLMNVNGPHRITIEANREKTIQLKEILNLSDVPNHITGGGSSMIHIKLIDSDAIRIL
ncbi:hypothetical protein [Rossellomorea aquimaris]|uniref:hypothetical protein n=1 Tax=Rossellomorea aquimaris TaxID=189382 RepID=UPI0007D06B9D|nr:hypothetical protein [Rossellomorea aquimaris]